MRPRALAAVAAPIGFVLTGHLSAATAAAASPTPTCMGHKDTIVGTAARDVIHDTAHADVIVARGGVDTIYGGAGDDIVCAGSGTDRVTTGYGRRTARRRGFPAAGAVDGGWTGSVMVSFMMPVGAH